MESVAAVDSRSWDHILEAMGFIKEMIETPSETDFQAVNKLIGSLIQEDQKMLENWLLIQPEAESAAETLEDSSKEFSKKFEAKLAIIRMI